MPTHRGLLRGRALPKRLHGTETAVNPSALQHEIGSDYRGPPAVGSERTVSTRPVHMHGLINDY